MRLVDCESLKALYHYVGPLVCQSDPVTLDSQALLHQIQTCGFDNRCNRTTITEFEHTNVIHLSICNWYQFHVTAVMRHLGFLILATQGMHRDMLNISVIAIQLRVLFAGHPKALWQTYLHSFAWRICKGWYVQDTLGGHTKRSNW